MTAPRNEVLSQEEAEDVKQRRFSAAHGSLAEPIEVDALIAIIDRLVSRIESDAARSAALRCVRCDHVKACHEAPGSECLWGYQQGDIELGRVYCTCTRFEAAP
jgi:hypothetical protein